MNKWFLIGIISLSFYGFSQKRYQFDFIDEKHYVGYHFDDDFLFIDNKDEQYTGGLEFEFISKSKKIKSKKGIFNPFKNGKRLWTASIGSWLFTPSNLSDSLIILNDRPYSSYIFSTLGYVSYNERLNRKFSAELYLGIIGSEFPGKVQESVHQFGDSAPTNGWQNRIALKETPIPNLRINYQRKFFNPFSFSAFPLLNWFQFSQLFEVNAGLLADDITAGIELKGFNYNQNTVSKDKVKIEVFFAPQWRFVFYNTTLQSLPWLNSAYFITPDVLNRSVWILKGGINLNYKRFHMNYVVQARTKEFKKFKPDWHSWAGVTMGFSF